jgi:hypothetical protein
MASYIVLHAYTRYHAYVHMTNLYALSLLIECRLSINVDSL